MKNGFYLSPCGSYIIEFFMVVESRVCVSFNLYYYGERTVACDGDIDWITMLFSSWEYLE